MPLVLVSGQQQQSLAMGQMQPGMAMPMQMPGQGMPGGYLIPGMMPGMMAGMMPGMMGPGAQCLGLCSTVCCVSWVRKHTGDVARHDESICAEDSKGSAVGYMPPVVRLEDPPLLPALAVFHCLGTTLVCDIN